MLKKWCADWKFFLYFSLNFDRQETVENYSLNWYFVFEKRIFFHPIVTNDIETKVNIDEKKTSCHKQYQFFSVNSVVP